MEYELNIEKIPINKFSINILLLFSEESQNEEEARTK